MQPAQFLELNGKLLGFIRADCNAATLPCAHQLIGALM